MTPSMTSASATHHTFTSPESFGLFMEALRDLQTYAEDTEKSNPGEACLEQYLDSAIEALLRGHQDFPGDLLPRYYLAIVLTMKNQHMYAKSIFDEVKKNKSADAGTSPSLIVDKILNAVFADRPWPLLDRAIYLFGQVIQDGYSLLEQAAKFNIAHVYAKRDAPGDRQLSLDFLNDILAADRDLRPSTKRSASSRFLRAFLKRQDSAYERSYREGLASRLQARTLANAVQARQAIQESDEELFASSLSTLEAVRSEIIQIKDLDPEARHDLMADSWTKSGFIVLLHAISHKNDSDELKIAENDLGRALNYKPFWIPAQTYLALVYVAQARLDDALKELASVVGTTVTE